VGYNGEVQEVLSPCEVRMALVVAHTVAHVVALMSVTARDVSRCQVQSGQMYVISIGVKQACVDEQQPARAKQTTQAPQAVLEAC
jgi:hypothetical protein